jgi:hypothetical protein
MNEIPRIEEAEDDLQLYEVLAWIEFGCWTAIALFPFLYWVNGPAVSTDQYVVRKAFRIKLLDQSADRDQTVSDQ